MMSSRGNMLLQKTLESSWKVRKCIELTILKNLRGTVSYLSLPFSPRYLFILWVHFRFWELDYFLFYSGITLAFKSILGLPFYLIFYGMWLFYLWLGCFTLWICSLLSHKHLQWFCMVYIAYIKADALYKFKEMQQ